ncbi:cytochrome P450 [Macroventuria anomochaeta]|uniref:Cytochrome P450 n=1 Tax=Macroventuria anomochaeta TaxID=301207 RepID=A0ACB6RJI3_9PLEO|nr:cytochrome P450 [Macroventuria anomochaeta]KAF2621129.1 cytochrome P450 [Macroventuria anomochaeta]
MLCFGNNPVLIISLLFVSKYLLDKRGTTYSSRPAHNDFHTFRLIRRVYHNPLGPKPSADFRKYQDFESKILISALLNQHVIFSACYGARLEQLEHPIMTEFYAVWEIMLQYSQPGSLLFDVFPFLGYLPESMQPWKKLAAKLRVRGFKLNRAFLHTLKKQANEGCAPQCFGTHLVQIQVEEGIDNDRACDILAMLIGAGADTTSSNLRSFFEVMLGRVVGSSRMPTWEDEVSLPYVRAVIKEFHRWAPIGSLSVPHATTMPDLYQGNIIPQGTVVFPNLTGFVAVDAISEGVTTQGSNRSPERYDNPEDFAPERFLGDNLDASASALDPDFKKRDHFHYGFGRHLCQGIFVAEASL